MDCSSSLGKGLRIFFIPISNRKEYMCESIARHYQLKELLEIYPSMNKQGAKELLEKMNPLPDFIESFERISHLNQTNPDQFLIKTKEERICLVNVHNFKIFTFKSYVSEKVKMQFELLYKKQKNINLNNKNNEKHI